MVDKYRIVTGIRGGRKVFHIEKLTPVYTSSYSCLFGNLVPIKIKEEWVKLKGNTPTFDEVNGTHNSFVYSIDLAEKIIKELLEKAVFKSEVVGEYDISSIR